MYTIYGFDSFSKEEYLDFFTKLLLSNYVRDIENVLNQPDPSLFYTIVIEFSQILEGDVNFGPLFIAEPTKLLPIFNEALLLAQEKIIEHHNIQQIRGGDGSSQLSTTSSSVRFNFTIKKNCKIRVCDLPKCKEISQSSLPRSNEVGLFVEFRGTVIRSGHTRVLEKTKRYECSKCSHHFEVTIDFEQFNQYNIPKKCPNPEYNCPSTYGFKPMEIVGEHCDYQEIKLQEQIHQLGAGSIPGSIIVLLHEDLVDQCQAGDDIIVSGIVIRRWKSIRNEERCDIEIVLLANYVRVMNEQKFAAGMTDEIRSQFNNFWLDHDTQPLVGRNRIIHQICSGVYGLFVVKLALLLVLIGGCNIDDAETGAKKRGECHLLLVGEPGTGKSQFLKFAAKIAQRSVLTTGIGTTTAGLTAASVKEPGSGEMVLEAGALVLADGGVCSIDEFSGIKPKDRATIHEAMEQQSLSIAKGGVISRLHTRTSIIAATNAKGKYDPNETLTVNTSLASPLLSRFDIILLLTDNQSPEWDEQVSEFILRQAMNGGTTTSTHNNNGVVNTNASNDDFWNLEMLQSYIYYVKGCFRPQLTEASKRLIDEYFKKQRTNVVKANESRTTVRLLESLIRLSQAHARLMFRNTVEVQDAIVAIFMLESSVESNCIFANLNAQHSDFPEDPEDDYQRLEKKIKHALGLTKLTSVIAPRGVNKPKPSNHKINSDWVNNDYDDEENNNPNYQQQQQDGEEIEEEYEEGYYEEVEGEQEYEEEQQFKTPQPPQKQQDIQQDDVLFEEFKQYEMEQLQQQQQLEEDYQSELGSSWADDTQYSQQMISQPPQKPSQNKVVQKQQQQPTPKLSFPSQFSEFSQPLPPNPNKSSVTSQKLTPNKTPQTPATLQQVTPNKTPVPPLQKQQFRQSQLSQSSFSGLDELSQDYKPVSSVTKTTVASISNNIVHSNDTPSSFQDFEDNLSFSINSNKTTNSNNRNSNTNNNIINNNKTTSNNNLSGFDDDDDLSCLDDDDIYTSQKTTNSKLNNSITEDRMVNEISKLNTQDNDFSLGRSLLKEMKNDDHWGDSGEEDNAPIFINNKINNNNNNNSNTNNSTSKSTTFSEMDDIDDLDLESDWQ